MRATSLLPFAMITACGCGSGQPPAWAGRFVATTELADWTRPDNCEFAEDHSGERQFAFDVLEVANGGVVILETWLTSRLVVHIGEGTDDGASTSRSYTQFDDDGESTTVRWESQLDLDEEGAASGHFAQVVEYHDADGALSLSCRTEAPFEALPAAGAAIVRPDRQAPVAGQWVIRFDAASTFEGSVCDEDVATGASIDLLQIAAFEDGASSVIRSGGTAYAGTWTEDRVTGHAEQTGSAESGSTVLTVTTRVDLDLQITGDEGTGTWSQYRYEGFSGEEPIVDCTETWTVDVLRVLTSAEEG